MLCVLATLLAELLGGLVALAVWFQSATVPTLLRSIPSLMLFSAVVTGGCSLVLAALTYQFGNTRPPVLVTLFSVAAAAVPLLICVWQAIR